LLTDPARTVLIDERSQLNDMGRAAYASLQAKMEQERKESMKYQDERQRRAAERVPAPPVRAEPPAQQHPHPAPAQEPPAVPVKQAEQADPIRAEALQYLGETPAWRQSRWDDLVKRTSAPPQPQQHLDDPKAALAAWQADRTQRGLSNAGTDHVHERCTRYGWTAESIRKDWQRQVDEIEQRRVQLERSGWRLFGRNSHAKEVDELHAQAQQMIKVGNAEIALASDWETFKPKAIAQENARREAAWKKDVVLQQRIAPHALAILEQDRQAAERAKAAKQVERAERQKAQQRSPARQESPDRGMGMG
jgi:hypothetical protein